MRLIFILDNLIFLFSSTGAAYFLVCSFKQIHPDCNFCAAGWKKCIDISDTVSMNNVIIDSFWKKQGYLALYHVVWKMVVN